MDHFVPFYHHPYNQENQNFEKMRNSPGDIIILHKCTINDNHIRSWDMEHARQNFCHFGLLFGCLPLTTLEIKILKKWNNYLEILLFYTCVGTINGNHMMYCSRDMKCDRQNFSVILGHSFPFYPTNNPIIRISKKWERLLEITIFYTMVMRYVAQRSDGQTEGRAEKVTYWGGHPTLK